ncbi:SMC family ATPase, partial [Candidatus Micrarchaeota archaeon]|nr:SMC family ATPase [Candidatus Micrarchaeota archaeon]
MLTSIRLINWRSHANTLLEFRKGTNLLVGIMGAGKSSVLEGITFALFGTFPALERRKLKLEDIVRLNEASAHVTLTFEWCGLTYRVVRTIEKSKKSTSSTAEIFKNDSLVETGPTAVSSYLSQLLGLDSDLFTRAIYSEQNNIDHFLNLDPRKRKQELDALLGLDKFEDARTNIVSVISRVKTKRLTMDEEFNRHNLSELEVKEKLHSDQLTFAQERLKQITILSQAENQKLTTLRSTFDEIK